MEWSGKLHDLALYDVIASKAKSSSRGGSIRFSGLLEFWIGAACASQ
jgi:hypothetical protein